jgi:hypothetical protein
MNNQQKLSSLPLDIDCRGYRNEPLPFKVDVYPDALLRLIDDAKHGQRVYELFSTRRPGDVKKYLWVLIKEVTARVVGGYHNARKNDSSEYVKCDWPENECPYDIWDDIFYSSWDGEPEDSAWLNYKHSKTILKYIDQCFLEIKKTQQLLKDTGDLLIKNEIAHLKSVNHSYDYAAHTPFNLTKRSAPATIWERHDEQFYQVLAELIAKPDIRSVAYRYGEDYRALRMLCNEQLRRVSVTGNTLREALEINVLSNSLPNLEPWGCDVIFYDEGLGYGDLYIDPTNGAGCSVKELCENYGKNSKYILTVQDFGEIKQYTRGQCDGMFIYIRYIKSTLNCC